MSITRKAAPEEVVEAKAWTISLPGWHPTRINQMIGRHFAVVAKLKRRDRVNLESMSFHLGIPPAIGKRRVTLKITLGPRQRAADPDAYWKSLLDACVRLKLLVDDNRQGVELAPVEFERGSKKGSVIVLEDIGAARRHGENP